MTVVYHRDRIRLAEIYTFSTTTKVYADCLGFSVLSSPWRFRDDRPIMSEVHDPYGAGIEQATPSIWTPASTVAFCGSRSARSDPPSVRWRRPVRSDSTPPSRNSGDAI